MTSNHGGIQAEVKLEGFTNEAYEGDAQNGVDSAGVFKHIDLGNLPNEISQKANNNVSPLESGPRATKDKQKKHKQAGKQEDKPVVFLGGHKIEVRHESLNAVRTTSQEMDNPAYEDDDRGNEKEGICSSKICLRSLLLFIIIALVAVVLIFLLLPKTMLSEVEVVVVLDMKYLHEYDDSSSVKYTTLVNEYTNAINRVFLDSDRADQYNGVKVIKLSPASGSVRVDCIVRWLVDSSLLKKNSVGSRASTEVGLTVLEAIISENKLGDLPVADAWVITKDSPKPLLVTCPSNINLNSDPGKSDTVVKWMAPLVEGNSGVIRLISNYQSGSKFPIGRSEVTYTAREPSGNRGMCNFTIYVTDIEVPKIVCPLDIGPTPTNPGSPVAEVTWPMQASDNSGQVYVIGDDGKHVTGKIFADIGQTIVSYTATDPSGNAANCSFLITVIDTESPQVTCPRNIFLVTSEMVQFGDMWVNPIINDNSQKIINMTSTADSATEFSLGITVVTFVATDPSGNVGSCNFTVTLQVADTEPPNLECPEDIVTFTFEGPTSRPMGWDLPKVSDNSGLHVTLVSSVSQWSTFPIGVSTVTYNATDFYRNNASCSFTITVQDVQPPYLECPDAVTEVLPADETTVPVFWNTPNVEDNSGGNVSLNVSHQAGDNFAAGVTHVTYSAHDPYDNKINCVFLVIVEDPKCGPPYNKLDVGIVHTINSTNYPDKYVGLTECEWIVIIPKDSVALVTIKDFQTEAHYDYVTIGGSESDQEAPAADVVSRFEGNLEPTRFILTDTAIWMTFFTDRGTTYKGFWIEILAVSPKDISACDSGYILVSSELCNGVIDCQDNTDETVCGCAEGEFQCDNGLCMPDSNTCNDLNDCGDYSDERYCPPCTGSVDPKCTQWLPYTHTFYPNHVAKNNEEASNLFQLQQASAVLDVCHPKAYLFACAATYPECPHYGPPRVPCSKLCQEVSVSCAENYANVVGSPWPVTCDNYRLEDSVEDLCEHVEGDFFHAGICGTRLTSNTRIVGGELSELGKWPWIASLRASYSSHKCGGTLIGDRWVLTAAHCVGAFNEVYLGGLLISDPSPFEEKIEIANAFPHPDYDYSSNHNDFAVVQLSRPVNFTSYVRPICLATSQVESITYSNCFIVGWGALSYNGQHSDSLMEASVPLITREDCASYYSNRNLYIITERMLCAGYEEGGIDACQGDSGGPLMCLANDMRWHLVGVTSFGDICALPRSPGVYTRVSQLESFISDVIKQVEDCYAIGFICNNNKCIMPEESCDKTFNCAGGEDELNCHHACSGEGLITLDVESLIEIRLATFTDVHVYCLWGFEAPPGYRIVLRAEDYYNWYYDIEIGEGIDPGNASSVVRKLPKRGLSNTAHFSVMSSKMWLTLRRGILQAHPLEMGTMLDVFIVPEADVTPCRNVMGEVVYNSAVCDGNDDCTNNEDESNCDNR